MNCKNHFSRIFLRHSKHCKESLAIEILRKLRITVALIAIIVYCSLFTVHSFAQLPSPLDAPLIISGSFGEPRDNHFHTGIDFTTRRKTGIKVFTVNDGYVSRIKVSSVGYGKALYITHPNGTMSVYGHLEKFSEAIQQYVTDEQYKAEKFEVELYPDKSKFKVHQGDVIAYSGNSGGSSAPHLHFEIRDASGESFPLNPLANGLVVKDTIPPLIRSIVLYDRNGLVEKTIKEIPLTRKNHKYSMSSAKSDTLNVNTPQPAFGVRAEDYANGVDPDGDFGIYSLQVQVDGKDIAAFKMDRLDFAEGRYANALVDYEKRRDERKRVYRGFRLPGNKASIYSTLQQSLQLNDSAVHEVKVTVKDFHENAATYTFYVRNVSGKTVWTQPDGSKNYVRYDKPYSVTNEKIKVEFDANTFYDNFHFAWEPMGNRDGALTATFMVGDSYIPVHKPYTLSLKQEGSLSESLRSKCVIMRGSTAYPTEWNDGWFAVKPKEFGLFRTAVDTFPPRLTPVNFKNNGKAPNSNIKLTVTDSQTGLKDYDIYIDGQWTLAEYDAKNDLLTVVPKQKPLPGVHEIKAVATDKVGNKKTYTYKLTY